MIKDLEDGKTILDCPDGPEEITGTLEVKKGGRGVGDRLEKAILLTLKMEEGAVSQGMQAASRGWRREGSGFFLRPCRENSALLTLDFSPEKPISDLLFFFSYVSSSLFSFF